MADDKPIIVVKKKGGHGGHHGGAWKIAYADFVTAMMAFFMVMWLVNSASVQTRQSIASYFRKPGIFTEGSGTPLLLGGAGILEDAFVPARPEDKKKKTKTVNQNPERRIGGESDKDLDKLYMTEGKVEPQIGKGPDQVLGLNSDKKELKETKRDIKIRRLAEEAQKKVEQIVQKIPDLSKFIGKLNAKIESDGLTIEIMDTDKVSMFDSGSARIRPEAAAAFAEVAQVIRTYPNSVEISGHTDAKPFPSRTGAYTNWELSADRANAARRLLESQGVSPTQIVSVNGKAATEPKLPEDPLAPPNRRITIKMKFNPDEKAEEKQTPPPKTAEELLNSPPVPAGTPISAADVATPTPTPTRTPTLTPTPDRTVVSALPTRIRAAEAKDRIKLPDGTPITSNPDYMPSDKVFKNNPVLGPIELYSDH